MLGIWAAVLQIALFYQKWLDLSWLNETSLKVLVQHNMWAFIWLRNENWIVALYKIICWTHNNSSSIWVSSHLDSSKWFTIVQNQLQEIEWHKVVQQIFIKIILWLHCMGFATIHMHCKNLQESWIPGIYLFTLFITEGKSSSKHFSLLVKMLRQGKKLIHGWRYCKCYRLPWFCFTIFSVQCCETKQVFKE